jgi:hypothetical protein
MFLQVICEHLNDHGITAELANQLDTTQTPPLIDSFTRLTGKPYTLGIHINGDILTMSNSYKMVEIELSDPRSLDQIISSVRLYDEIFDRWGRIQKR